MRNLKELLTILLEEVDRIKPDKDAPCGLCALADELVGTKITSDEWWEIMNFLEEQNKEWTVTKTAIKRSSAVRWVLGYSDGIHPLKPGIQTGWFFEPFKVEPRRKWLNEQIAKL